MLKTTQATKYSTILFEIATVLEEEMGGSSGSLLSIFFTAAAAEIRVLKGIY